MPVFSDGQKISAALAWDRMIQSVPASYVIWYDSANSLYRAECLIKGGSDYSGTDAATVIQSAIDYGGLILLRKGTYTLSTSLNNSQGEAFRLVGEEPFDSTKLRVTTDIPIFTLTKNEFTIENLYLLNEYDGSTEPVIKINSETDSISRGFIKNVMLYRNRVAYGYDDAVGIQLYAPTSGKGIAFVYFDKINVMGGFKYGFHLYAPNGGGWINGNFFTDIILAQIQYGVYLEALGSGTSGVVNRNSFSLIHVQAADDAYGVTERGFVVSGTANTFDICKVWDLNASKNAMEILSTATNTVVRDSVLSNLVDNGSGSKLFNVDGYVTENGGTATISNGSTSIVVSHGCDYTPSAEDIDVHPIESLGSASFWWVDTITSTQFTIHVNADPGQDVDFKWSVRRI